MKKTVQAAVLLSLLLCLPLARAGSIVGSPHDFLKSPWVLSAQICTPCHAPHSAGTLPAPLWDSESAIQTFPTYGKTRLPTMAEALRGQPDGMSKICLSCHDGIIALDRYGRQPDTSAGWAGGDRHGFAPSSNHPISFVYDTALATKDGRLYDPSTRLSGLTGSKGTIAADMLFSNRMECSSCHDVHNTKAAPGTKLLVKDTAGSALCLTCHNK